MIDAADFPTNFPIAMHATAISVAGQGILLRGPSGSGKSSFALQMMGLGAGLISDDLVWLSQRDHAVWLERPPQDSGPLRIEARGIGILHCDEAGPTPLRVIIDLSKVETQRLPKAQFLRIGNTDVRHLLKVDSPAFPAMVLQYSLQIS